MGNIARERVKVAENGAKVVAGFSGTMRDFDFVTLEKGMKFTYTGTEQVYEQEFNGHKTQFVLLPVNGNPDNVIPFYPSVFWKSRSIVNEDGSFTGERVHTTGTAAEAFRACNSVQEGMEAIKGREFIVSDIKKVRCFRYGTTQVVTAYIPVIDFV